MNSQIVRIINRHLQSRIPLSQSEYILVAQYLDFVYSFFGNFFITGYRFLFTYHNVSILSKRLNKVTQYLLVILTQNIVDESDLKFQVQQTLVSLKNISQNPKYEVCVASLKKLQLMYFNQKLKMDKQIKSYKFNNPHNRNEQEITYQSQKEFVQLNKVINDYLDRSGKAEISLIHQYFSTSVLSFDIDMLLHTIDYIIFKEVKNSHYCQMQSQQWSMFFEGAGFVYHRRHTILKGNGEIMLIYWLFTQRIQEDYLTVDELKQIGLVIKHYKGRYSTISVKVISLRSQLQKQGRQVRYVYDQVLLTPQDIPNKIKFKQNNGKRKQMLQQINTKPVQCIMINDDDE